MKVTPRDRWSARDWKEVSDDGRKNRMEGRGGRKAGEGGRQRRVEGSAGWKGRQDGREDRIGGSTGWKGRQDGRDIPGVRSSAAAAMLTSAAFHSARSLARTCPCSDSVAHEDWRVVVEDRKECWRQGMRLPLARGIPSEACCSPLLMCSEVAERPVVGWSSLVRESDSKD